MAKKTDSRKKTLDKIAETDRSVKKSTEVPTRKRATVASHARKTSHTPKKTIAMASSSYDSIPYGSMTTVENWGKLVEFFGKGGPPIPFVKEIFLIECEIAGTTYVDGVAQKTTKIVPGSILAFRREPENEHDPWAILVLNEQNEKIGYVPRTKNEILAHLMDGGKLLFGRVEEKHIQNDWVHIAIKVYMRDL